MAQINETIAAMLAAARPQQAPPQTRPAVVSGGGPLINKSRSTNVGIGVDIKGIMNLIGVGPEAEERRRRLVEGMQNSYMQRSEQIGEINAKKEVFDNPMLQTTLKKSYEEDGNINVGKDEVSPGVFKYYPKRLILPQQAAEAAAFGRAPEEIKQKSIRPSPSMVGGLSGAQLTDEERKRLINAQIGIAKAGAGGAGAGDKILAEEYKSWNDYLKQYGKAQELAVDDPTANYVNNTKLADRALSMIQSIKRETGNTDGALGAVKVVGQALDREMVKDIGDSKDRFVQHQNYINIYSKLLDELGSFDGSGPIDIGGLSRLMDWFINLKGEQAAVDHFSKLFGSGEQAKAKIQAIYSQTRAYQLYKTSEEERGKVVNNDKWYDKIRPIGAWADFFGIKGYKDIRPVGVWTDFIKDLKSGKKNAVAEEKKTKKGKRKLRPGELDLPEEEKRKLMKSMGM